MTNLRFWGAPYVQTVGQRGYALNGESQPSWGFIYRLAVGGLFLRQRIAVQVGGLILGLCIDGVSWRLIQ